MGVVDKFCKVCQRWGPGDHDHPELSLLREIRDQNAEIIRRLGKMASLSEELSQEITDLGGAVDGIASFISTLPTSVDDVTQQQLDDLRAQTQRIVSLAQAAPEVPTGDTPAPAAPVDGGTDESTSFGS